MQEVRARKKGGTVSIEITPPYKPTAEDVRQDIRRFMEAFGDVEDVPLQEANILNDLESIMDHELLHGLNRLLRHWHWTQPNGLKQSDLNEVYVVEELRQKLELLVKARMRDVLQAKLKPSHS